MNSAAFKTELSVMLSRLLAMANESSIQPISDNCQFFLSEIEINSVPKGRFTKQKFTGRLSTFDEVYAELEHMHDNLYDINLFVFKAHRKKTTIEVKYLLKSSLKHAYPDSITDKPPMIHAKVATPPYRLSNEKFDINWEFGRIRARWKLLIWKLSYHRESYNGKRHQPQ